MKLKQIFYKNDYYYHFVAKTPNFALYYESNSIGGEPLNYLVAKIPPNPKDVENFTTIHSRFDNEETARGTMTIMEENIIKHSPNDNNFYFMHFPR